MLENWQNTISGLQELMSADELQSVLCDQSNALHWAEIINARGMSQSADGGVVGSKPYVSSAQYLKEMGHYCKGCHYGPNEKVGPKAYPFNALYWCFYFRQRQKLERNPRIERAYLTLDRMDMEKQRAPLPTADINLNRIEEL